MLPAAANISCGEGWIRTIEGYAGRFTVCSLWPLGNLTLTKSWREDLNPQQVDYKSTALPIELRQQIYHHVMNQYTEVIKMYKIIFVNYFKGTSKNHIWMVPLGTIKV